MDAKKSFKNLCWIIGELIKIIRGDPRQFAGK